MHGISHNADVQGGGGYDPRRVSGLSGVVDISEEKIAFDKYSRLAMRFDPRSILDQVMSGHRSDFHGIYTF